MANILKVFSSNMKYERSFIAYLDLGTENFNNFNSVGTITRLDLL
jgi:hypothetical protein